MTKVKEILKDIGLTDFFRYVCPGAILLLSFLVWVPVFVGSADREPIGTAASEMSVLIAGGVVVLSYIVGLLLESLNQTIYEKQFRDQRTIGTRMSRVMLGTRSPWIRPGLVDSRLKIQDYLEEELNGEAPLDLFDLLELYRVVRADKLKCEAGSILERARTVHRQVRFSLGVSLALSIVALHILAYALFAILATYVDLGIGFNGTDPISYLILLGLALCARLVGGRLNKVVEQRWTIENHLTAVLFNRG